MRKFWNRNRHSDGSSPPPSPPPRLPGRAEAATEEIPIVFGQALPSADRLEGSPPPVVAAACEVVVSVDESNDTVASSYAIPANNNHGSNNWAAGNTAPGHYRTNDTYNGGFTDATSSYLGSVNTYGCAPSPHPSACPPSQICIPDQTAYGASTSPTSVRSSYTTSNSYGLPPAPTRNSVAALRSSSTTTTPLATSNGLQLQQLSMVNLEGRRMTPYVNKPSNRQIRTSDPTSNSSTTYQIRPGSRMTSYV